MSRLTIILLLFVHGCSSVEKVLTTRKAKPEMGVVVTHKTIKVDEKKENTRDFLLEDVVDKSKKIENFSNISENTIKVYQNQVNIGFVLPMSKIENVEKIIDTVNNIITENEILKESRIEVKINFYNLNEIAENDNVDVNYVKRIIGQKDNNQILFILAKDFATKQIAENVNAAVTKVSFNNISNPERIKNMIIANISPQIKVITLLEYMKENRRSSLALLLTGDKYGYDVQKLFLSLTKKQYPDIKIITTEFYQEENIADAVNKINRVYEFTYNLDEDGNRVFSNIKSKKNLKQQKNAKEMRQGKGYIDTVFISSNGMKQLNDFMLTFHNKHLTSKEIEFFSDALITNDMDYVNLNYLKNINFIGYKYNYIQEFNKNWREKFNYSPNFLNYLVHDTLSSIIYVLATNNRFEKDIYVENGFRGVLDEFQFDFTGHIKRKLTVYKLINDEFVPVFKPSFFY
jgi:hypothetical protein